MSADSHARDAVGVDHETRTLRLPAWDVAGTLSLLLPFVAVVYLGLVGGGYDTVVRGQVGVVFWWLILVGALAGLVPVIATRRAAVGLVLLLLVLAWTWLSILWTDSDERTVLEIGRISLYVGALVIGLTLVARGRGGHVVAGVGAAITALAALAVAARLHPSWFPSDDIARQLGDARRLAYPLNYWNGLAALAGMGVPVMLAITGSARTLAGRAAAAAALPVLGTCILLTQSRGGLVAAVIGLLVFFVLAPDRLPRTATAAAAGAGTWIVHLAVQDRPEVRDGLTTASSYGGDSVVLVLGCVIAGTAIIQLGVSLADRHAGRPKLPISTFAARLAMIGLVGVALAGSLAGGLVGELGDGWESFKSTESTYVRGQSTFDRLSSVSGEGRYQMWSAAVDAHQTKPLIGRGPGTYEYWWSSHGDIDGIFVRDAHSLYLQTLAELGIVGLVLLAGFLLYLLVAGVVRTMRSRSEDRVLLAAAVAAMVVFAAEAAVDWIWQLAVIPIAMLFLAAAVLGDGSARIRHPVAWTPRISTAVLAAGSLLVLAVGIGGSSAVADSQRAMDAGNLDGAAEHAATAIRVQPYSATAHLQAALVLESIGDLEGAATEARLATEHEPLNWRTWLIRSRISIERGRAEEGLRFFREARSLNPRSPIFGGRP